VLKGDVAAAVAMEMLHATFLRPRYSKAAEKAFTSGISGLLLLLLLL
jgi:hypothetical protein